MAKYEGTRLGRQELHGEVIEDVEGALWTYGIIAWVADAPPLDRIVVSIDPAGSVDPRADETGIIVIGRAGKNQYVLADLTGKYTPEQWARVAWDAHEEFSADMIATGATWATSKTR
jgi:phage terminase large subunit-like protein